MRGEIAALNVGPRRTGVAGTGLRPVPVDEEAAAASEAAEVPEAAAPNASGAAAPVPPSAVRFLGCWGRRSVYSTVFGGRCLRQSWIREGWMVADTLK